MITKLHSIDPERLGEKKGTWYDTWLSLKRGGRMDFMEGPGGIEMGRSGGEGERMV